MATETKKRVPSAAAEGKNGHSLISNAKFRQLYELALKLQMTVRNASGRKGRAIDQLRGHEAMLAGVAADLRADDVVVGTYAASVDEIQKGRVAVSLDRRSFEERVIEALCDAVGDRMRKTGRITVIFLDRAQGGKILTEARTLANAAKLPVLFVEDGQKTQKKRIAPAKRTKGTPAASEHLEIPVDTKDVIAMYRVAHESIARARDGSGPTHIVGVRWQLAVSGRKRGAKAEREDALTHLEQWLIARGLPAQEWRREIVAEFEASAQQQLAAHAAAEDVSEDEDTETRAIA